MRLKAFASSLVEFRYYKGMVPLNASPKRALALARQSMNRSSCKVNYSSGGTVSQFSRHWVKIRNFKDLVLVLYPPTFFGIELLLSLPIPFEWFSVIYCHTLSRPNHGPLFKYLSTRQSFFLILSGTVPQTGLDPFSGDRNPNAHKISRLPSYFVVV